jgi:hypothetical protein
MQPAPPMAKNAKPVSLSIDVVKQLVEDYLLDCFRTYIQGDEGVSDVSCTPEYDSSKDEINVYSACGKFKNFLANGQKLYGIFKAKVSVHTYKSFYLFRKEPVVEPEEQKESITLFVSSSFTDNTHDSMITDYINHHYNNPLHIKIHKSRREVTTQGEIYSYVTFVVDRIKLYHLRAIFKCNTGSIQPQHLGKLSSNGAPLFIVQKSPWELDHEETIAERDFPDEDQIKKDIQKPLFAHVSDHYTKNVNTKTPKLKSSKVEAIETQPADWLVEANEKGIHLDLNLRYALRTGWVFERYYRCQLEHVHVLYEYNMDHQVWVFGSCDLGECTVRPQRR